MLDHLPIGMGLDFSWILIIISLIITGIAQARVSGAYAKYKKLPVRSGITGAMFAQNMLSNNGIHDLGIKAVQGELSDHYDPRTNTVNLSEKVYTDSSVASVAVAAHECGHVLQKYTNYKPMSLRGAIVPITNFCSQASFILILVGIIFSSFSFLVNAGAIIYFVVVIFQLVTLPVEFNASARALKYIEGSGVVASDELKGAKSMLKAAAMTYVASMLAAFLTFLRLILIANRRR